MDGTLAKTAFAILFSCTVLQTCRGDSFVHPGIGLNAAQLTNIVHCVKNGVEPWKGAYDRLCAHDHRFSKKPHVRARRDVANPRIDSPDFDNRCQWDGETAVCQIVQYHITGEEIYLQNAFDLVRWYYCNVKGGNKHWDSQFRWPYAEKWYLMACELLRYTEKRKQGTGNGERGTGLDWTDEDTKGVNEFIKIGEGFWWGRGTFLNQLQWTMGGPLARAIWRDDYATYCEMVEIVTSNAQGPVGEQNGSIREMCRLVVTNETTGASVAPHVQYTEMGRDIGHAFPGYGALCENLAIMRSQGTKIDPGTGEVSDKPDAVEPIEFLSHRMIRAVNQICKYNLGFDIDWTPIYINREKGDVWNRPSNAGGGRGRIVDVLDFTYNWYRFVRGWNLEKMMKSEETRYFTYAHRLRGQNDLMTLLFTPPDVAGKWHAEWIDPGRDGVIRFGEVIRERGMGNGERGIGNEEQGEHSAALRLCVKNKSETIPVFLHNRKPLPKAGEYILRYRTDGDAAMGVINPEDYGTEFEYPDAAKKRKYVEKVALPNTKGEWADFKFALANPPNRNLVKLRFATRGTYIEIDTLKAQ